MKYCGHHFLARILKATSKNIVLQQKIILKRNDLMESLCHFLAQILKVTSKNIVLQQQIMLKRNDLMESMSTTSPISSNSVLGTCKNLL